MRTPYRFVWCGSLLASGVALCLVSIGRPAPTAGGVTIFFTIPESKVSLHEPVHIQFSIQNGLEEGVRFDLGLDGKHNFEFSVKKPDGSLVRIPPAEEPPYIMGRAVERAPVAPGKTFTKTMLLNEWYQFALPGRYVVEAKLGGLVQTVSGVAIAPAPIQEIPVQVTARDPKRLKSVCEELTKKAMNPNYEEASQASRALSYVDDPLAVPYLGRILKEAFHEELNAIDGLMRIGNPEAVQILTSYSNSPDPQVRTWIDFALKDIQSRTKK